MAVRPPLNDQYKHGSPVVVMNWTGDPVPITGSVDGEFTGEVNIPPATKGETAGFTASTSVLQLDLSILGVGESVYYVNIKADIDNTAPIYYGYRNTIVTTKGNALQGFQLNPGDEKQLPVYEGAAVYVIADSDQYGMYEVLNGG